MSYLLGMTKYVAHDAVRPAAPLAAFLVGYATAIAQGEQAGSSDLATVHSKIASVEKVVQEWRDGQA